MQAQYEATAARQAAGMATQADVLSALKSVQDQDTAILTAQKSADNVHRSLCLMLGWAVDGQPEIRDVPEPDLNRKMCIRDRFTRSGTKTRERPRLSAGV